MIVTHPLLKRILKRIKLTEEQAPSIEQWHEILKILDRYAHDTDQAQYLNELSINVSSREMAEKNKELTDNIEKLKMLQQKLIQSEKMATIGQLSAGIAHEINNPLSFSLANLGTLTKRLVILMNLIEFTNTLIHDQPNPVADDFGLKITNYIQDNKVLEITADLTPLLNEIKAGLLRIMKIVSNLGKFANKKIDQMKLLNINSCIQSALDICRNELNEKCEITLHLNSSVMMHGVFADLEVLFINLLLNAKQSITEQGRIKISSKDEDGTIIITIEDNGCGINLENINKIFDPFFTTRLVGSGVGLGLSVAYGIIEIHRGKIQVESKPTVGSIFTIFFPAANDLGG